MRALIVLACCGLLALAADAVAAQPGRAAHQGRLALQVVAKPGHAATAAKQLRAAGLRVDRRSGRLLQVIARPARRAAIAHLPAVATVAAAPSAFSDVVIGQGIDRTGASALLPLSGGGAGLTIAILDLGFGPGWPERQGAGELPPSSQLETKSFDSVAGLDGTNAYGNFTNHGEIVAQTVYDYVPRAHYLFVNYHTPQDFVAAVDWLTARHPDIVVHSNNFLDGPFDGTSAPAQAVDRAAHAGILWFNSAGNYAQKHWSGPWVDADNDGALDWPGDWTFSHEAGQAITFHLSWDNPAGTRASDLDLLLQQQASDGSWTTVASSTDRQVAGAPGNERINGYRPPAYGVFRLRVVRFAGPAPSGPLTLFSREDELGAIQGSAAGSVPTPGDAAGAIAIGAVDWRGNTLKRYSSEGPTADGRLKPDLVAPTGTSIVTPEGPRDIGGTSNAAPNAAGAAAVLIASERAAGLTPTADAIRAELSATALDLGVPGPDPVYGAGRVRVESDPPTMLALAPKEGQDVRGITRFSFDGDDPSQLTGWTLSVDGVKIASSRSPAMPVAVKYDTRALPDGPHTFHAEAGDWPGNRGAVDWHVVVDNTPPALALRRLDGLRPDLSRVRFSSALARRQALAGVLRARRPRLVTAVVTAADRRGARMRLVAEIRNLRGRLVVRRRLTLRDTTGRGLALGRVAPGRYRLSLSLTDRAGNERRVGRRIRVR